MHLFFESSSQNLRCDSAIRTLSWMGRVPDEQPEGHGWKLNRSTYYQEGWLATGNTKGTVGVTFTSTLDQRPLTSCASLVSVPARANYNLRGHRSQVCLVQWNEPYQKLATCDTSGIIFVWIRYEGRWSIELINDRNTPVTHFSWSHDGRMALIAYQDGFVLVGSVAGQRYWSTMLNQESSVTAGAWTPDDQQVYLGTSNGSIIVLDVHNGSIMAQVHVTFDSPIRDLSWNCPRFKMEEPQSAENIWSSAFADEQYVLAVMTESGRLIFMKGYDDLTPSVTDTNLCMSLVQWNNSGKIICAGGYISHPQSSGNYSNMFKFYTSSATLRYSVPLPYTQAPITGLTWGHNDRRLFVATGNVLHVAWVSRKIPSLEHMTRLAIRRCLHSASQLDQMQLPTKLKDLVAPLFSNTVQNNKLDLNKLNEFLCQPPPGNTRLYCTIIRKEDETLVDNNNGESDTSAYGSQASCGLGFTLYLEFLGGLIPLLKGKPTSKIRPDFLITQPCSAFPSDGGTQVLDIRQQVSSPKLSRRAHQAERPAEDADQSDSATEESCVSTPRLQRRWKRPKPSSEEQDKQRLENKLTEVLASSSVMPEIKLAEVTSNIWGTKFKIQGLDPRLPMYLGYVTYKTSLLHLQPRQMTLAIVDLKEPPLLQGEPNKYGSEDEDDDEHIKEESSPPPLPIAPSSPNFRLRSGDSRRSMEPPPSPTHQIYQRPKRDAIDSHIDDILRVELNAERVVLSPFRQCRSFSVGYLDCVLGCSLSLDQSINGTGASRQWSTPVRHRHASISMMRRKSRSLDSSPAQCDRPQLGLRRSWAVQVRQQRAPSKSSLRCSPPELNGSEKKCPLSRLSPLLGRKFKGCGSGSESRKYSIRGSTTNVTRGSSEPATPNCSPLLHRKSRAKHNSPIRQLLSSPLLGRRFRCGRYNDNSDDEFSNEDGNTRLIGGRKARKDVFLAENYEDLESFQKAQLFSKAILNERDSGKRSSTPDRCPKRHEYILHNKAPLWNEHSQVYQLDFGGRVTQESAKNFQIEFKGKQVMQFGRIDGNAYTLDFQYPFSAVQAFAVALANVTQRLK